MRAGSPWQSGKEARPPHLTTKSAMADGLTILNPHLEVVLYNGGAISADLDGIAQVFDEFMDVEAYHETAEGRGFDVVLKAKVQSN